MELNLGNVLRCPSGTPGTADKVFEMEELHRLDVRREEISRVNKVTAPELMQTFVDGYGIATRILVQLEWELAQARKFADERKAVVYLEVAPKFLQEKGLVRAANPSGSEDQRKSVLALDNEYQKLNDRLSMIEAALGYLKLKAKQFEMSYQSVKKVYDSLSSVNALANGVNAPGGASPYQSSSETNAPMQVGKPRY